MHARCAEKAWELPHFLAEKLSPRKAAFVSRTINQTADAITVKTEEVDTIYGTFLCWPDEPIARQLKEFSAHTRNEIAMIRRFLAPGDIVVDVGAHIGTYAIPFARFVAPGGKVLAFEASPENFSLLVRNVAMNGLEDLVETVHGVVSDSLGTFEMRQPPRGHSGMCYFVEALPGGEGLSALHLDGWLAQRVVKQRIAFMKIDVEGAELSVLRSSLETLVAQAPMLYIEIVPSSLERFDGSVYEVEDLLRKLGYRFFRNVGERNSLHDEFRIAEMGTLAEGGAFFDVLAVHPSSARCAEVLRELQES